MKFRIAIILFFTSIAVVALAMTGKEFNPEKEFMGSWNEIDWNFKEAEKSVVTNLGLLKSSPKESSNSIRIHSAKNWDFKPNGVLILHDETESKSLEWRLKGRGHILEITDGQVTEFYDINSLSENKIELNFIAPSYVKDHAKLVIERT